MLPLKFSSQNVFIFCIGIYRNKLYDDLEIITFFPVHQPSCDQKITDDYRKMCVFYITSGRWCKNLNLFLSSPDIVILQHKYVSRLSLCLDLWQWVYIVLLMKDRSQEKLFCCDKVTLYFAVGNIYIHPNWKHIIPDNLSTLMCWFHLN